ncbi:hypothetical protein J2X65_000099 [Ancylobacter sp. 3268]|uniref:hypothetical protein n=1 Tax=Ancylobacter sp. 3268 TaxID=2817752 RepID=UPI0028667909|nr:hypothetical protein [Ancylobacter sp. 3268]MDR6950756.1 hypothetical protein [Ancylobacter sp. 3268]
MSISLTTLRRGAAASLCLGALVLVAAPALADKAAADACAAGLNADGKAIYAASFASISSGGDVRGVVTDKTRSLAMGGKIDRGAARTNAEAAGKCLALAGS